jgi:2-polyprenyl-3-methyl-5-hydroxy-6-metoxy-1,4-benzoquinol methylase
MQIINSVTNRKEVEMSFKVGVHNVDDLKGTFSSSLYKKLELFSNIFLESNKKSLESYRWIKDSLNQWSRVYEYPYTYEKLSTSLRKGSAILDAGCGVTFFPFLLGAEFNVTAVDQDDYKLTYSKINNLQNTNVNFINSSLNRIPFPDESFDAIYCISVLEHTENYEEIIKEFNRLLKPNGLLVVTFDISLNVASNSMGINRKDAAKLIATTNLYFDIDYAPINLDHELDQNDIYTSRYATKKLPETFLPWPKPTLFRALKAKVFGYQSYSKINLTFCNYSGRKK